MELRDPYCNRESTESAVKMRQEGAGGVGGGGGGEVRNLHLCQCKQYYDSVMTDAEREPLSRTVYRLITAFE